MKIKKVSNNKIINILSIIIAFIGLFVLAAFVDFAIFTFGYWLITLVLANFFNFILPFSFWYSLGAWLIYLIIYISIFLPGQIGNNTASTQKTFSITKR